MNKEQEKASEFIEKYTKQHEGKPYIDAVGAIIELYSRIKSAQNEIKNLYEGMGDYGGFAIELDKRVCELEGKKTIEVVSQDQAKIILRG